MIVDGVVEELCEDMVNWQEDSKEEKEKMRKQEEEESREKKQKMKMKEEDEESDQVKKKQVVEVLKHWYFQQEPYEQRVIVVVEVLTEQMMEVVVELVLFQHVEMSSCYCDCCYC